MRVLAFETSTEACSCALLDGDECRELFELAPRRHAELILPMAERLMAEAGLGLGQLDALAFGRGPGAFTGIRIATGAVQGIAFAADLPVAPISSLQALAQGVLREQGRQSVVAAFDARMHEVYWGAYRDGGGHMLAVLDECVSDPGRVPQPPPGAWFGAGQGWAAYRDVMEAALGAPLEGCDPQRHPHARDVAELGARACAAGATVAAEQALPVYLRDKVV